MKQMEATDATTVATVNAPTVPNISPTREELLEQQVKLLEQQVKPLEQQVDQLLREMVRMSAQLNQDEQLHAQQTNGS